MKELTLSDLETAIDATCRIYGGREMIVVGSSAILGAMATAPIELRRSDDIDLYPAKIPADKNDLIARDLGLGSEFGEDRGFYVEGVGDWTTKTTPEGWQTRLLSVETPAGNVGHCLAPSDLAFNKIEADREKDIPYVAGLIQHGFITAAGMEKLIAADPREDEIRGKLRGTLRRVVEWAKAHPISMTPLPEILHLKAMPISVPKVVSSDPPSPEM